MPDRHGWARALRRRTMVLAAVTLGLAFLAAAATLIAFTGEALAAAADSAAARPLSLRDAVGIASGEAPVVEIAMLREHQADARVGIARAALLPSLTGTADAVDRSFSSASFGIKFPGVPDLIGPFTNLDARVRATQTVFDWSSWKYLHAAHGGVAASRAERGGSVEAASQQAALAYVRAARALALSAARATDLVIAQQLGQLAEAQVAAGATPQLDETRANTRIAEARSALLMAETQRDRTQIELARALGLDPATRFTITDTLSSALGASGVPEDESTAVGLALKHRPEIVAEAARRAKTRDEKSAIAAEIIPRVGVEADYGANGEHTDDLIGTGQVSVGLTMPILDGWRRQSRVDEHNAAIRESEVREHDLRDQAAAEVGSALLELRSGLAQEQVSEERLSLAERELAEASDRFESGVTGNLDVINAQAGLSSARDARIEARFAVALARVNLARAAGSASALH